MRREGGSKGSRVQKKGRSSPGQTSRPVGAVPAMAGEQPRGGHHVQAFCHTEQDEGSTGNRRACGNRASLRNDRFGRRVRAAVHLLRPGSRHACGCARGTGAGGESGSLRPRSGDRQARGRDRGLPEPCFFRRPPLHACDVGRGGRLGSGAEALRRRSATRVAPWSMSAGAARRRAPKAAPHAVPPPQNARPSRTTAPPTCTPSPPPTGIAATVPKVRRALSHTPSRIVPTERVLASGTL